MKPSDKKILKFMHRWRGDQKAIEVVRKKRQKEERK
jgi:hypothetical protein